MILAGILGAAGMLALAYKIGIRKVINYDIFFDIVITSILMYSLAGTYAGMMAALVGGLMVTIVLYGLKQTMDREKLTFTTMKKPPFMKAQWTRVAA